MNLDDAGFEYQSPSPGAPRAHVVALVVFGALVTSLAIVALSVWPEDARVIEAAVTLLGFVLEVVRTIMITPHDEP